MNSSRHFNQLVLVHFAIIYYCTRYHSVSLGSTRQFNTFNTAKTWHLRKICPCHCTICASSHISKFAKVEVKAFALYSFLCWANREFTCFFLHFQVYLLLLTNIIIITNWNLHNASFLCVKFRRSPSLANISIEIVFFSLIYSNVMAALKVFFFSRKIYKQSV